MTAPTQEDVFTVLDQTSSEPVTASEVADELGISRRTAYGELGELAAEGLLETKTVGDGVQVWWRPTDEGTGDDRRLSTRAADDTDPSDEAQMLRLHREQRRIIELIATGAPLEECLKTVCETISDLHPGVRASVSLLDDEGESFGRSIAPELEHSWEDAIEEVGINGPTVGTCQVAVGTGKDVTSTDIRSDERWSPEWRGLCAQNRVLAGHSRIIRGADDTIEGSLMLCFDEPRAPTEWEEQLADFGTRVAGIALEREHAEQARHEIEEQFRAFVTASSDVVYQMSPDWTEMRQLEGRNFLPDTDETNRTWIDEYIPEDERPRVRDAVDEAIRTKSTFELEHQVRQVDGGRGWTFSRAVPITNDDGDIVEWVGTATDITDRKEREQELQLFRTLLNHSTDSVLVVDPDTGQYLDVNETACRRRGYTREELLELSVPDLETEIPDRESWTELVEEIRANDEITFDGEHRRKDGSTYPVEVNAVNIELDREYILAVSRDVTERRERERQLEQLVEDLETSNERLEQFAYAASHDLQEPLRMVSSYLQLIESRYGDQLDEDGEEFLQFAVGGADRMRDMIQGLLEYSRVETQGDPLGPVDLYAVLADVVEDLHLQIAADDADITVEELPTVEGDANQLRQLFQNLLSNAIEYSGDDPPSVRISAERAGSDWCISVQDEGIGIDPDDTDRIFEIFQTLHTQAEHAGTGIGLALCERIVERHGGDIWVESEPGEGTTFSFTLSPADESD